MLQAEASLTELFDVHLDLRSEGFAQIQILDIKCRVRCRVRSQILDIAQVEDVPLFAGVDDALVLADVEAALKEDVEVVEDEEDVVEAEDAKAGEDDEEEKAEEAKEAEDATTNDDGAANAATPKAKA